MNTEQYIEELGKIAGLAPEFLAKAKRGEFVDPRSDDFSKNRAFGPAALVGATGATVGSVLGTESLARDALTTGRVRLGRAAALAGVPAATGLLAGYGVYRSKLRKARAMQAQGLNPVTGKPHDPARIERTRKWVEEQNRAGADPRKVQVIQNHLNRQVLEDHGLDKGAAQEKDAVIEKHGRKILMRRPLRSAMRCGSVAVSMKKSAAMAFTETDRPKKVKEIYRALKRDHPDWPADKKARIAQAAYNKMKEAAVQRGAASWEDMEWKQGDGFEYKGPIASTSKGKKKMVLVRRGGQTKTVHFGQKGYEDFTQHGDEGRRANYLTRSAGIRDGSGKLTANNPLSANYWARRKLW